MSWLPAAVMGGAAVAVGGAVLTIVMSGRALARDANKPELTRRDKRELRRARQVPGGGRDA